MQQNRREHPVDDEPAEAQVRQAPVVRMLANPRRTRRA
jgi:hypothetical protein